VLFFGVTLLGVLMLIALSVRGTLAPVEGVVAVPLNLAQRVIGGASGGVSGLVQSVRDYRRLEQRNKDLEEALAIYQAQLAELREKAHDYDRLAALLEYDRAGPEDRQYVTCDVIGKDSTGFVRAVQIDCGRRDGVSLYDPVVTELGLVGRIVQLSATGAQVLLLTDSNSAVTARVQRSRVDAVLSGQLTGDLLLSFIPPDGDVREGDLVVTSGLGQIFPADVLLGQVLSVGLSENELYQEARIRSLVDFDRLEMVQVMTNFEPVDLSVFEQQQP